MQIALSLLLSDVDLLKCKAHLAATASKICAGEQTQEAMRSAAAQLEAAYRTLMQLADDEGYLVWTIPGDGKSPTCE